VPTFCRREIPTKMNIARATGSNRRPFVGRFFVVVVVIVVPLVTLVILLPSLANAQRVASLGSRLKRRFGGASGSGSYVVEQGEDVDGSFDDNNWLSSMIHMLAKRPGMFVVVLAFFLGYLYYVYAQKRVSEIERKLHQKFKRLGSAGEFSGFRKKIFYLADIFCSVDEYTPGAVFSLSDGSLGGYLFHRISVNAALTIKLFLP
jgi:hypothetical protein